MKIYTDVKSKIRPLEIDIESSNTAVYENSNIRIENINVGLAPVNGRMTEVYQNMYIYDCRKYTREEWIFKMLQRLNAVFIDPTIDPNSTMDTIVEYKTTIMKNHYNKKINAGIDIELNGVVEHYSLSPQDQINIDNTEYKVILLGMPKVIFNSDNSLPRLYTNREFLSVSIKAKEFILRETAYCNFMINYIKSFDEIDKDKLLDLKYGDPLPSEMEKVMNEMVDEEIALYREAIKDHLNITIA